MNSKVTFIFGVLAGAAVGCAVTYKLLKDKYAKIAQEEIDSVKEVFSKRASALENEVNKAHKMMELNKENDVVPGYSKVLQDEGYISTNMFEEEPEDEEGEVGIVVISPDDFDGLGYKTESLIYYADGVLAYETDEKIENYTELIGSRALNTFGEYENDTVFVRNHKNKTDYEICKDVRKYSDVTDTEDSD